MVGAVTAAPATDTQPGLQPSSLAAFLRYFLYLGTVGFGGPIALAGYMQRDLVERRRWITDRDYSEGLALAQLAPGPLAAQLAIYLGWVRAGVLGATLVGVAFVLPSFLMVLAIAALYVTYGGLPWMHGAFYGIGAAVIAIIARSVLKLARLTLAHDRLLWAIGLVNALVTAWTESEIFWLFVGSGVIAVLIKVRQRRPVIAASLVAPWSVSFMLLTAVSAPADILLTILRYFTVAGLVVFGSGLAVVPFLHGGVVQQYHWLTERQFLDAVAVSMITPGPVVITVAFIGYLVAGASGRRPRRDRDFRALLPDSGGRRPLFPPPIRQPLGEGVRGWRHGRGDRRHCGSGVRARTARHRRSADRTHRIRDARPSLPAEATPRASAHPCRGHHRDPAQRCGARGRALNSPQ